MFFNAKAILFIANFVPTIKCSPHINESFEPENKNKFTLFYILKKQAALWENQKFIFQILNSFV